MDKIRVLIVDDHALFRDGLRAVLEHQEDMYLVGEANDAGSAIRLAAELRPDVILMDLHLPGRSGIEATRDVRASQPSVKVIALSMRHDAGTVDAMIQAGAQGYVLKEARAAELMAAIRAVAAGGAAIDPSVASEVLEHYRRMASGNASHTLGEFSERELSLLRLLAEGENNRTIAARLHLSQQTVKNLLSDIYRKLGVRSRAEAVAVALRQGVIRLAG
jgi:DNA-binding NarL/FixJ family response regulator